MSTIVKLVLEAERASRVEASEEALRQALRQSLQRSRQEQERVRAGCDPRVASPDQAGPIGNNSPGRPVVHVVGRARAANPIRSAKSRIVPEPDQTQSTPPVRPALPHWT